MRNIIGQLLIAGGAVLLPGCRPSTDGLWRASGQYDLEFVVVERAKLTPELQRSLRAGLKTR